MVYDKDGNMIERVKCRVIVVVKAIIITFWLYLESSQVKTIY